MRFLENDPNCFLVEIEDLTGHRLAAGIEPLREPLEQVAAWAKRYLCNPHPELGRAGPVCPFVQAALDKRLFFLAIHAGDGFTREEIAAWVMRYRDWFLRLEPREGAEAFYKTILILFPDLPAAALPGLIDATQTELRSEFVAKGLMLGEFHPTPPVKAGLWNPEFRPLRAPVPMLVIRHMVPTDFPFLKDDPGLVAAYLEIYRDQVPVHIKALVHETARGHGLVLEDPPLHPRVRAALRKAGAAYKIHRHADQPFPIRGPADFARALGVVLERITKSVFLRCTCHGKYLVVVSSINKELQLRRLALAVGCKRLELASNEELAILLGYPAQGVPPMAVGATQVLMDEELLSYPTILVAAGEVEIEIEIAPSDLRRVSRALLYASAVPVGQA